MAGCITFPSHELPTLYPGRGPTLAAPSQGGTWNPSYLTGCQLPPSHCLSMLAVPAACLPEALHLPKLLLRNQQSLKGVHKSLTLGKVAFSLRKGPMAVTLQLPKETHVTRGTYAPLACSRHHYLSLPRRGL